MYSIFLFFKIHLTIFKLTIEDTILIIQMRKLSMHRKLSMQTIYILTFKMTHVHCTVGTYIVMYNNVQYIMCKYSILPV